MFDHDNCKTAPFHFCAFRRSIPFLLYLNTKSFFVQNNATSRKTPLSKEGFFSIHMDRSPTYAPNGACSDGWGEQSSPPDCREAACQIHSHPA
jgi:hypothetical protein